MGGLSLAGYASLVPYPGFGEGDVTELCGSCNHVNVLSSVPGMWHSLQNPLISRLVSILSSVIGFAPLQYPVQLIGPFLVLVFCMSSMHT